MQTISKKRRRLHAQRSRVQTVPQAELIGRSTRKLTVFPDRAEKPVDQEVNYYSSRAGSQQRSKLNGSRRCQATST